MHFPIICLEQDQNPESWVTDIYEDSVLDTHTDYYGELFSEKERQEVIESEWLKNLFDGIATIDPKKGTITFLDAAKILVTLHNYFLFLTSELRIDAENYKLTRYQLERAAENYKNNDTLFYMNKCGYTSMQLVCDAEYYAEQTWYIGNMIDAHI